MAKKKAARKKAKPTSARKQTVRKKAIKKKAGTKKKPVKKKHVSRKAETSPSSEIRSKAQLAQSLGSLSDQEKKSNEQIADVPTISPADEKLETPPEGTNLSSVTASSAGNEDLGTTDPVDDENDPERYRRGAQTRED